MACTFFSGSQHIRVGRVLKKEKTVSHVAKMLENLLPIQSYRIADGDLKPKRMGSSIFERGDQQKSIDRFVEKGFTSGECHVTLEGVRIPVYVVGLIGSYPINAFEKLFQELAEGNPKHTEWSDFRYHARKVAGLSNPKRMFEPKEQLWLHFGEDVFWTLHEDTLHELTMFIQSKRNPRKVA